MRGHALDIVLGFKETVGSWTNSQHLKALDLELVAEPRVWLSAEFESEGLESKNGSSRRQREALDEELVDAGPRSAYGVTILPQERLEMISMERQPESNPVLRDG